MAKTIGIFGIRLAIAMGLAANGAVFAADGEKPLDAEQSKAAVKSLQDYLQQPRDKRAKLAEQSFAKTPLTRDDATVAQKALVDDHVSMIRDTRAAEMKARKVQTGKMEMPFFYKTFGDKPAGGRSLFISMHGGGGAPKAVNDSQWENQKKLYTPKEGVYLAPRAPTDTWNLWHESHIDDLFDRLIEDLIVFEDVDPNRVYLMGYSAGGDGTYQLAPRMADRFAAASMMAGHPNDASPLGLRNLPFAIWAGGNDAAYNRNKVAQEWSDKLDELKKQDADGYTHQVKILPGKGHWMDREDAAALPWMAEFNRNPLPAKIVWKQSKITHPRFYWLAVDPTAQKADAEVVATHNKQSFDFKSGDVKELFLRLNDQMCDLDQPLALSSDGKELKKLTARRTIDTLAKTLAERGDPQSVFSAEVRVDLPK